MIQKTPEATREGLSRHFESTFKKKVNILFLTAHFFPFYLIIHCSNVSADAGKTVEWFAEEEKKMTSLKILTDCQRSGKNFSTLKLKTSSPGV